MKKKVIFLLILFVSITTMCLAHSGRTDSSGGHHDYNNKSGLGSYHYHHGYSVHLHKNGVCPYETTPMENEEIYTISNNSNETIDNTTNEEINNLKNEITYKQRSIAKLNNSIEDKDNKIKSLNSDIEALWIGFIFVFLLGICISYNIGLNKR